MKTQPLKRDLLRREFPDYFEVGKVYPLPRVPEGNWEESSWHNDVCPSWRFMTGTGLYIRLWADYPEEEDRELENERFLIQLENKDGEFICQTAATDDMDTVTTELAHLVSTLK